MAKKKVFIPPGTIDGSQLMDEWDCDADEIIELVNKGELKAFDSWFGETVDLDNPPFWTPGDNHAGAVHQATLQMVTNVDRGAQKTFMQRYRFMLSDLEEHPSEPSIFPCEAGTSWEDITITLVADDTVRIQTPTHDERLSYHELRMSDKRAGDRPKAVWVTLKLFCELNGFTSSNNSGYDRYLVDKAHKLNKHLQELFGIDECIYQGHYKAKKGYITRIKFRNNTYAELSDGKVSNIPDLDERERDLKEHIDDEFSQIVVKKDFPED